MPLHRLRWSLACTATLLLACSSLTDACACPPARTHAVIYGSIRTAADQPAVAASVEAAVFGSVCGQGVGEPANPVRTDAAGVYRLRLHSTRGPRAACVRVSARGAGAVDSAHADAALEVRDERMVPDSIRLDLHLP